MIINPAIAEGSIAEVFNPPAPPVPPIPEVIPLPPVIEPETNPYLKLITSAHKQPIFQGVVDLLTKGLWENQKLLATFPDLFDIDKAVGDQLDILGDWIGLSRYVAIPITDVFFSFDIEGLGFDQGYWSDGIQTELTTLPDEDYRIILKAKIAFNNWNGSIPSAIEALSAALPKNVFYIIDNQDMSMILGISGPISLVTQSLLTKGYFDLRPTGVSISYASSTKFFGWNIESTTIGGWGSGSWYSRIPL